MNTQHIRSKADRAYQCPVCGNALPHIAPLPPFDAPCSECGSYLWCRRVVGRGTTVLEIVPGRSPEPFEVDRVVKSLLSREEDTSVILDLSPLELVNSSFMARLIMMNRRIRAGGGKLLLRGLQPVVRDIFDRAHLDRALDVIDDEVPSPEED